MLTIAMWLMNIGMLKSQVFDATGSSRDAAFAYEVKQIDEFFERFNDVPNALIKDYIKKEKGIVPTRKSLVASLFDRNRNTWEASTIQAFMQQVLDTAKPQFAAFDSQDWYADVQCQFLYKGKPLDITLLLNIEKDTTGGMKWMITNVYAPGVTVVPDSLTHSKRSTRKFLNPISHATGFIGIAKAFDEPQYLPDYVDSACLQKQIVTSVLKAAQKKELVLQQVKKVRYHFLQLPGWLFTVEYFDRPSHNAGWLISYLEKANDPQKAAYKRKLYHEL
ncbi:hypothetical protein LX64_01727 [Chitinophaga skermanii]|uniref:Uncharacterized protein n=2 Tax=Chitinophaga skermanii TaxID=331697 RepID=A0A327QQI6_9BACT|nr:hypothetical protein LX64_01727 [Chitinophaga skermanii]